MPSSFPASTMTIAARMCLLATAVCAATPTAKGAAPAALTLRLPVAAVADNNKLLPPYVACPEQGVAQNELPCPGAPGDVPLPGKPGTRTLPLPGLKPDPLACPQNGEGKPELLGLHDITPVENFYVRSHGAVPQRALDYNMTGWQLQVDGEVKRAYNFTMEELQKFPVYSRQYVLECAGNGRHGFRPAFLKEGGPASGNQWTIGAAGNANFTGILLKDVLQSLGLTADAKYIAWYGDDHDCSGSPDVLISRGFDVEKAMDEGTMLVWEMNGKPLHAFHGFPLRVFAPGYPGAAQGKWLRRIWVRNQTHDGPKMTGWAYRMPKYPLWPGSANTSLPPDQYSPPIETEIITKLGVRAMITAPSRCTVADDPKVLVEGRAWSGAGDVTKVEVSYDHGSTWTEADTLSQPVNQWAWQKWSASVTLPSQGSWRIMARATDVEGRVQPIITPGWNPKGYMSNAVMNVDVTVTASASASA